MKYENLLFGILGIALVFMLLFLNGCEQKESSDVTEQELTESMGSLDNFNLELNNLDFGDMSTEELDGIEDLAG